MSTDPATTDENAESTETQPPGYLAAGGQMTAATAPGELQLRGWRNAVAALHYTDYRRIWSGALFSNVGSWMQNVARDWLILQLGGLNGKWWLGLNAFAEGVPLLLLLPIGGVVADRVSRKWIIIITNCIAASMSLVAALLAYKGWLVPWHILALTAGTAAMDGLRVPANQSMLPELVAKRDISNAIALNSMQFNLSRIAGPALGGLVLVSLGAHWSFSLNALSFMAVLIPLTMLRPMPAAHRERESMFHSLRQGASYVASRADLVVILLLVILGGFLSAPLTKFLSALSDDVYHRGATGFTMLLSCFGIGAVIGAALMAARSKKKPTPWRAFPLLVAIGACQLMLAVNTSFHVGLAITMLCGLLFIGAMVRLNTAILSTTPSAMRGRTSSFHVLAFRMGMPLGGLLAGAIAQHVSLRWTFASFGLAMMVIVPLLLLATSRRNMLD